MAYFLCGLLKGFLGRFKPKILSIYSIVLDIASFCTNICVKQKTANNFPTLEFLAYLILH